MDQLIPPILIMGNVRSGTTMMLSFFDLIENLATWFEPRTIWKICHVGCNHDQLTADMATPRVVERIRNEFLKYQEAHGGRRVVDKTPGNVVRIPFVHKVFSESKILHIYRNGLDSVSSALPWWRVPIGGPKLKSRLRETPVLQWPHYLPRYLRDHIGIRLGLTKRVKSWGVVYPGMQQDLKRMDLVQVIAKQWVNALETAHAQLRELDPGIWIETRYEYLVANPAEQFQRVLDFFDLQMTPALDKHLRENVHQNVVGAYKRRLSAEQIEKIIPIVRPTMERLGYDIEEMGPRETLDFAITWSIIS